MLHAPAPERRRPSFLLLLLLSLLLLRFPPISAYQAAWKTGTGK